MGRCHKVINVYDEDVETYRNAKEAAAERVDADDPTEGDIIAELSRAYTGWVADGDG